jgi:uncharacterized membrane protein
MTRKTLKWARWTTFVFELAGLIVSTYLVLISLKVIYPGEVPCPRGKLFHCASVLRGEWSKLGPVPISILGMVYFLLQAFLTAAAEQNRLWVQRAKLILVAIGVLYIAWLRAVEIVWLKGLCPWCWAVAFLTLAEAYLLYPLASPPLPKAGWGKRLGILIGGFVVCVVAAVIVAFVIYEQQQARARTELKREVGPKRTPLPTPSVAATKVAVSPTVKPTVSPAPTKAPALPPVNEGSVEEGVPVTNEVKILVRHGWTVVAATESVDRYIREQAPVLLLVFDPWCEECQAFIRGGLESDEIRKLPVKLVAIEQGSLNGKLSDEVENVPTLMLLDRRATVLFKHVGRMGTQELIDAVERHLKP